MLSVWSRFEQHKCSSKIVLENFLIHATFEFIIFWHWKHILNSQCFINSLLSISAIGSQSTKKFKVWLFCLMNSVAKVLFRTAPENQNRQNRTVKFGSVLFTPRNSWSCSVLSSYIWEDIQNRVWTSSNRTSSDIILCFQTEAAVCLSECHLFFLFLFGQHGTFIKSTLEKSLGPQETTVQDPRKELCDYLESPLEHVNDPVKWQGVSKPVSFYAGLTIHSSTIPVNTLRYPRWLMTILLFKARRLHPRGPFRV